MPHRTVEQVTKHAEFPQTRHIDKVAEVSVKMQRQVPQMRQVTKHVENPQTQLIGKVVGQSSR